jgi:phosphoribosylaminoimidazole-succinocarboxamide synthase
MKPTPDEIHLADEREALQQEGSNLPIDVVRRNVATGELIEPKQQGLTEGSGR